MISLLVVASQLIELSVCVTSVYRWFIIYLYSAVKSEDRKSFYDSQCDIKFEVNSVLSGVDILTEKHQIWMTKSLLCVGFVEI